MGNNKKCRWIAGNFVCHTDAVARRGAHCPIQHIPGFTRSQWMLPLGECLRRIAPVAIMVNEFIETTLNTNKTQLLPSNYGTFWLLVVCENLVPRNGPSTQRINATSCIKMWNTTIVAEELANFSSYQRCEGTQNGKVIERSQSLIYELAHICPTVIGHGTLAGTYLAEYRDSLK